VLSEPGLNVSVGVVIVRIVVPALIRQVIPRVEIPTIRQNPKHCQKKEEPIVEKWHATVPVAVANFLMSSAMCGPSHVQSPVVQRSSGSNAPEELRARLNEPPRPLPPPNMIAC